MHVLRDRTIRNALRLACAGLALVLLSACGREEKAAGAAPMSEEQARYLSDENLWRVQREERLVAPDGWTTLIGLHFLTLQSHYIGSGPRSGIRIAMGPESLGMVQRNGKAVSFVPEPGVPLTVDGQPLKGRIALNDDSAGPPTVIGFDEGKGGMTLISRGGRQALRLRHEDAPTRRNFIPIDYWKPDPAWRVQARYVAHPPGKTLEIGTIIGTTEPTPNPGAFEFERDGQTYRIEALDHGEETLQLIIADRTSGHESYGAGRYLDVARPGADGKATIDFNRAYNPPCAFTQFATCPLPPNENRLNLAITAGEKRYPPKKKT
jgi:uncharacterized protein (DUF1684 family)